MEDPPSRKDEGVFYAPEDYAGLLSRFLIVVVDLGVLLLAFWILLLAFPATDAGIDEGFPEAFLWSCCAMTFVYLVVLESWAGTLGFLLLGTKIVALDGRRPSLFRMTFRFLLMVCLVNPVVDLFWSGGDRDRQTLRDKFSGTYVVKKGAVPRRGAIKWSRYSCMGYSFMFPEVCPMAERDIGVPARAGQ